MVCNAQGPGLIPSREKKGKEKRGEGRGGEGRAEGCPFGHHFYFGLNNVKIHSYRKLIENFF
jgi:hypothetical protein